MRRKDDSCLLVAAFHLHRAGGHQAQQDGRADAVESFHPHVDERVFAFRQRRLARAQLHGGVAVILFGLDAALLQNHLVRAVTRRGIERRLSRRFGQLTLWRAIDFQLRIVRISVEAADHHHRPALLPHAGKKEGIVANHHHHRTDRHFSGAKLLAAWV